MMLKLYCSLVTAKTAFMKRFREEKGSHTVEIVIFIAIAVGLALLFKDKVAKLISDIFNSVDAKDLSTKPEVK